jgi:hypothetical protein
MNTPNKYNYPANEETPIIDRLGHIASSGLVFLANLAYKRHPSTDRKGLSRGE